jgi:formate hydrogenlyase subunit 3/multisubunit Na+/H+ antiporter MnhD subunit
MTDFRSCPWYPIQRKEIVNQHIIDMILLLPVFFLIIAAAANWFSRKQALRIQWALSAVLAVLIWILTLLLRLGPDQVLEASVWQPIDIFRDPISFSFDSLSWPIIYAVVTVLVAMIFTAGAREGVPPANIRSFWFLYSASAILAILADNLLTIVIAWTLFDLLSAFFLFSILGYSSNIRQVLTRLSIDVFGVMLLLAGIGVSAASGDSLSLDAPFSSVVGVILLGLAGFVRLGLMPLHFNLPQLIPLRRGMGSLLRLYPPALVLTFLARLFRAGVPSQVLIVFLIAGLTGILIGGIRWVLETDSLIGRPFFILVVSGIAVFALSTGDGAYLTIIPATIILLLAGSALSLTEIHAPSHRIFAATAPMILLAVPIFPSGVFLGRTLGTDLVNFGIWPIIVLVGLGAATLGSMHLYFSQETPWRTSESLVRVTYTLGLALPFLSSIGIGFYLNPEFRLINWILLAIQVLVVGVAFALLRRVDDKSITRLRGGLSGFDPARLYGSIGRLVTTSLRAFRSLAELIEGEAAILWIYAVVAFLVLASS